MKANWPDQIVIGRIVKPQGVRGEVKVKPLTDHPPRFTELKSVTVELTSGETLELTISDVSLRGTFVYLTFDGIGTREQAERLRGGWIQIHKEEVLPLADDEFYGFEVEGFVVRTVEGKRLGVVEEVLDLPANAVFVVREGEQEWLIPAIKEVVRELNRETRELVIQPLEGMLS